MVGVLPLLQAAAIGARMTAVPASDRRSSSSRRVSLRSIMTRISWRSRSGPDPVV